MFIQIFKRIAIYEQVKTILGCIFPIACMWANIKKNTFKLLKAYMYARQPKVKLKKF